MTHKSVILVDIWSGPGHMNFTNSKTFNEWKPALAFVEEQVEAGNLANVLHTDFSDNTKDVSEAIIKLVKDLKNDTN